MADAHSKTDDILENMEKYIYSTYDTAMEDLKRKFDKYMKDFDRLTIQNYRKVQSGEWTEQRFAEWRYGKICIGKRWKDMVDYASAEYTNANKTALAYINDRMPEVYSLNYNEIQANISGNVTGYSFSLVNESAVKYMAENKEIILPKKNVNIPKDRRWNAKQINAQVLQGIIQGESNKDIAKRLMNVTDMCKNASIRNARTMTTSAENRGRFDSMKRAEERGVQQEKEWLATSDSRTRPTHSKASGQRIAIDKPFSVGNSKLMYPADPNGDACEVYNCRCTVLTRVIGFTKVNTTQNDNSKAIKLSENFMELIQNLDNKEEILEVLDGMSINERNAWIEIINNTNYCIGNEDFVENEFANYYGGVMLFSRTSTRTFFHETGHALDFSETIKRETIWQGKKNRMGEWREIYNSYPSHGASGFVRDYENMVNSNAHNESLDLMFAKFGINKSDELNVAIDKLNKEFHRLDNEGYRTQEISDMVDGLTKGKYLRFVTTVGHEPEYWESDTSLEYKEFWANYCSLKSMKCEKELEIVKELFPEKYEACEICYNSFADGTEFNKVVETVENDREIFDVIWRISKN